jgi:hypothetical protein
MYRTSAVGHDVHIVWMHVLSPLTCLSDSQIRTQHASVMLIGALRSMQQGWGSNACMYTATRCHYCWLHIYVRMYVCMYVYLA